MINKDLFYRIAEQIESHPETFNMNTWYNDCESTACIAGWAIIESCPVDKLPGREIEESGEDWLWRVMDEVVHEPFSFAEEAAKLLGIDQQVADTLFYYADTYTVDFPTLLRKLGNGEDIREYLVDGYDDLPEDN